MSAPYITIIPSDAATHARRLQSIAIRTRDLQSDLEEFIAESFQMFDGSGDQQFALPATKYGVASVDEAHTVFDLLNGTLNALKGTAQNANAVDLATRIG